MRIRHLLAVAAIAVAALFAAPSPVSAGPTDNANAGVDGYTSVPAGACPYNYLCLYTQPGGQGRMFVLYNLGVYTLRAWNGVGSIYNHQPYVTASLADQNGTRIGGFYNTGASPTVDFRPAYYVNNG